MKNWLLFCLLLAFPAVAQQTVYHDFETEISAIPNGGMPYLNIYLQANLRKPILAESKGTGGRVIVSGIVEPDGRISTVKVVKSLQPDLDREAIRVFSLFNAWKPGQKDHKPVRQEITVPVMFKPNAPFPYSNGARIAYYGKDMQVLADSSEQAVYKQTTLLDTNGVPNGDVIVYKRKQQAWKEYYRLALTRQKAGTTSYYAGVQKPDKQWQGRVFEVYNNGQIKRQNFYTDGKPTGYSLVYHPNGVVAQLSDNSDTQRTYQSWYANGQIQKIWSLGTPVPSAPGVPEQVTEFWDSTGHQLVADGNGRMVTAELVRSLRDTTQRTQYVEEGDYANGIRQGVWTGRYADGSYFYQEQYDKGVFQIGKSLTAGSDTVRYTVLEQQAEFPGGMPGLGEFLSQNLRYPSEAQRARVQGKVMVSFVVCTDGSLCDYEVTQSVAPSVDQEALRVVKAMSGRWKPGVQRGKKVRVKYNMPINFTLQ